MPFFLHPYNRGICFPHVCLYPVAVGVPQEAKSLQFGSSQATSHDSTLLHSGHPCIVSDVSNGFGADNIPVYSPIQWHSLHLTFMVCYSLPLMREVMRSFPSRLQAKDRSQRNSPHLKSSPILSCNLPYRFFCIQQLHIYWTVPCFPFRRAHNKTLDCRPFGRVSLVL